MPVLVGLGWDWSVKLSWTGKISLICCETFFSLFQDTTSKYEFVEVSTGAKLNRHNLHIEQLGPETETELSTLHLTSQNKQIHDLHSRLILDHPRGFSRQLHKCIACGTGNSIFDGNIKVNRYIWQLYSFLLFCSYRRNVVYSSHLPGQHCIDF
jgi:hypothetical protein